jgi:hypothetical protein
VINTKVFDNNTQRGDMVAMLPAQTQSLDYIKRVVGAGDEVSIRTKLNTTQRKPLEYVRVARPRTRTRCGT